jgi:brefeldin A-resistance guanine nucleotide exchange factor 1
VLHTISSFDEKTLQKSAQLVLAGISNCIKNSGSLRNEMTNSPDFWAILRSMYVFPDVAPMVFELVEDVTSGNFPVITADNYAPAISLLNDFASYGGFNSSTEPNAARTSRRAKTTKQPKQQ